MIELLLVLAGTLTVAVLFVRIEHRRRCQELDRLRHRKEYLDDVIRTLKLPVLTMDRSESVSRRRRLLGEIADRERILSEYRP